MLLLTSSYLKQIGILFNLTYFLGIWPYRWSFEQKQLYLPKAKLKIIPLYISFSIYTFYVGITLLKLVWVISQSRVTFMETLPVTMSLCIMFSVCINHLNNYYYAKMEEIAEVINNLLSFVMKFQGNEKNCEIFLCNLDLNYLFYFPVEYQSSLSRIRQSKVLEYILLIMTWSFVNAVSLQLLVTVLIADPRISISSFLQFTDFKSLSIKKWDLNLPSLNFCTVVLNLYTIFSFIQTLCILLSALTILIIICLTIPIVLNTVQADFNNTRCAVIVIKKYRQIQILVYRICYAFEVLLPLHIWSIISCTILFFVAAIKLNSFITTITLGLSRTSYSTLLEYAFYCAFSTICIVMMLMMSLIEGQFYKFQQKSKYIRYGLRNKAITKQLGLSVRSLRVIEVKIGSFGAIDKLTFLKLLAIIFDNTILIILTQQAF